MLVPIERNVCFCCKSCGNCVYVDVDNVHTAVCSHCSETYAMSNEDIAYAEAYKSITQVVIDSL